MIAFLVLRDQHLLASWFPHRRICETLSPSPRENWCEINKCYLLFLFYFLFSIKKCRDGCPAIQTPTPSFVKVYAFSPKIKLNKLARSCGSAFSIRRISMAAEVSVCLPLITCPPFTHCCPQYRPNTCFPQRILRPAPVCVRVVVRRACVGRECLRTTPRDLLVRRHTNWSHGSLRQPCCW